MLPDREPGAGVPLPVGFPTGSSHASSRRDPMDQPDTIEVSGERLGTFSWEVVG